MANAVGDHSIEAIKGAWETVLPATNASARQWSRDGLRPAPPTAQAPRAVGSPRERIGSGLGRARRRSGRWWLGWVGAALSRDGLRRYAVAPVSIGAALALALPMHGRLEGAASTLFLIAVVVSGWLGGFGPALLATAASFTAIDYLFEEPRYSMGATSLRTSVDAVLYLSAGLIVSALQAQRRTALARAAAAYREAREAIRLRDEVLATAAHDVRTPLAVLKTDLHLLRRSGIGGGRLDEGVTRMTRSVDRVERLMDELLDAAALQMGKRLALRLQSVDLVELARRAAAEHGRTSTRHQILVQADVEALPGQWDEARLERVLDNVLSNAVKYSPDGGRISVVVSQEGGLDGWAVVRVRDSGTGIAEVDVPRLRQRFERGANARATVPGSGIGLVGAYAIVEAHGGRLDVESRVGVGTTVIVRLPRRPATAQRAR